jgi:hypothetical protein
MKPRSIGVLTTVLVALIAPALAEERLTLHQGPTFSLYSSGNCKRVQREKPDVVLSCQFDGKQATLALLELPRAQPPAFDDKDDPDRVQRQALSVLNLIDLELAPRVRLFGGSSQYAMTTTVPTIINRYGFLYKSVQDAERLSQDFEKRILVRVHYSPGRGAAVLVAMSDFDPATLNSLSHGVPDELLTTFASLELWQSRQNPP